MARSLPLGIPAQAIPPAVTEPASSDADAATTLSGTIAVYDPAMCCPTGVCGPGVDPALLQVARDLRWLQAQGVTVERFGLTQEPAAFAQSDRVAGLLQAFGDRALPATLVNGEVLAHGRYPAREEMLEALSPGASSGASPAAEVESPATSTAGASCCAPGSGCC